MLSPEAVRACYRVMLGREPETEAIVSEKTRLPSYEALLTAFLECGEFLRRFPKTALRPIYQQRARRIDVNVSDDDLDAMFERIRREWSKLGDEIPYWSVLTNDIYRTKTLDPAEKHAFFSTGEEAARSLDAFAARCGVTVPAGRCVEFGAGVGRVTIHLAPRFEEVVAVDVSPGNLAICAQAVLDEGAKNVTTLLLHTPQDVRSIPEYDVLFSTIVLQHNPPPVQLFLLEVLLSKLRPGGVFLFQTPTHMPRDEVETGLYQFDTDAYLSSAPTGLEMHDVPMPEVFKLLARCNAQVLEVLMDHWTGLYGSHTFFGVKPG